MSTAGRKTIAITPVGRKRAPKGRHTSQSPPNEQQLPLWLGPPLWLGLPLQQSLELLRPQLRPQLRQPQLPQQPQPPQQPLPTTRRTRAVTTKRYANLRRPPRGVAATPGRPVHLTFSEILERTRISCGDPASAK